MNRKQMKSLPWRRLGDVILIIIKISVNVCLDFLQELSKLWEVTSNTRKRVSYDIQALPSWPKKTWLRLIFWTHFSVFGCLMKFASLFLIYYVLYHIVSSFNLSHNVLLSVSKTTFNTRFYIIHHSSFFTWVSCNYN